MASSRSGDPRKRAAAKAVAPTAPLAPTPADQWVSKTGPLEEDIRLPSGNVARVRRVGPEAFLTNGLMPDSITPIVEKAIHSKKGLKPVQQAELVKDPKKIGAMMEMLDRTTVYAVVSPSVSMPPACRNCGELDVLSVEEHDSESSKYTHDFNPLDREPGVLYVDTVDLDDKMFIMNFVVGGTRDLERFRGEFGAGLASLSAVEGK